LGKKDEYPSLLKINTPDDHPIARFNLKKLKKNKLLSQSSKRVHLIEILCLVYKLYLK